MYTRIYLPPPDDHFPKSVTSQPEFERPSGRLIFSSSSFFIDGPYALTGLTLLCAPSAGEYKTKNLGLGNDETG
jgi:hypothetical protein